ncbi:hypothetical protein Tco_0438808 [Tanacetum coccineum]
MAVQEADWLLIPQQRLNMYLLQVAMAKDPNEKKLIQMIKIHTDKNVADLLTKAFDPSRWEKRVSILEATIRKSLQSGRMRSAKTTAWNGFSSTMASAIIYLATNQNFNFSKYIFESMVKSLENMSGKFLMYPRSGRMHPNRGEKLMILMLMQDDDLMFDTVLLILLLLTALKTTGKVDKSSKRTQDKKGFVMQEPCESINNNKTIPSKDKGKGIMVEEPLKVKKKDQISFDEQEAIRLQAKFDEEVRLAREKDEANVALIKEWSDIQVKIDADYQLAQRMLKLKEQES